MSKPQSRSDHAYAALRQAIIEQALLPGTKLPEDEIGAHFGMSRTLARSTLARLKGEGLVEAQAKRTATVARPSLEEARDVFEVRRALEREAVGLVARRWKPEFGTALDAHVRAEGEARTRRDDRVSIRLAGEFHTLLAGLSGNNVLARALAELVTRCSLILALYGRPHSAECAVTEHSEIIAALRKGDSTEAIRLMEAHVGSVEQRALLHDVPSADVSLGTLLARYAAPTETGNVVPLRAARRGRKGSAR